MKPIGLFVVLFFTLVFEIPVAITQQADSVEVYTLADTARARALLEEVVLLISSRDLTLAMAKANRAKDILSQLLGENSKEVSDAWHQIARVYYYSREYEKAIESWKTSLSIRKNIFGIYHREVAIVVNNIGIAYELSANYKQAITSYKEALEIRSNIFGLESVEVADVLNNLGNVYKSIGEFNEAENYYKKSLLIREKLLPKHHPELSHSYANLATIYLDLGRVDLAIEFYSRALDINKKSFGDNNYAVAITYANLALSYSQKSDFYKSLDYNKKALSVFLMQKDSFHPAVGNIYNNIGVIYLLKGDELKAMEYYTKALQVRKKIYGESHPDVASAYINIGRILLDINEDENAIKHLNSALDIFSSKEHVLPGLVDTYHAIGDYYLKNRAYKKALEKYSTSLQIAKEIYPDNHPSFAHLYTSIGGYYKEIGDFRKTLDYYNSALKIREKHLGPNNIATGWSYSNLGRCYALLEMYDSSLMYFSKSLISIRYDKNNEYAGVVSYESLLRYFSAISNVHYLKYLNTSSISALYSTRDYLRKSSNALKYHSHSLSPASKSTLAVQAVDIYSAAITTNQLLYQHTDSLHYLHESFDYAERSKAYLLYEAMQEADALHIAGIPDSLLQQEYDLRVDIAYYDKKRQEKLSAGLSETDTAVLEIASRLFDLNREYETLKGRFESGYPQYYQAKYALNTIPVNEVQQSLLQPHQTLLEYTVGDSSIFLFLVQKDNFEVMEIKKDFPLEQLVQQMTRDGIYGFHTLPEDQRTDAAFDRTAANYTEAARKLYEKLLPAAIHKKLTPELIIVPDGVLGYVPFEALLTGTPASPGDFRDYPYLVYKHQISYCYSATLLREMRDKQHRQQPSEQLLALAPFFLDDVKDLQNRIDSVDLFAGLQLRDSLQALPASGDEVASVSKLWTGQPIYGREASLDTFRQLAAQYRILHLSTHGQADDRNGDYAYLAFSKPADKNEFDKLYARDLYNLELNADLVVLSACETGTGKLQRGEGIVSLARGFAYAGAKSLITSLWKVNDQKTKELMVGFYRYLLAGKTKDEALQLAKIDFLKNNPSDYGAAMHPFFWAGFIAIGDMRAVK